MCYERRRTEDCVDEAAHHALVNAGGSRFPNERNQGKQAHPVIKYLVPHGSQPRPGWAPDLPMVGIRSPIGLVVGSCTSHPEFWVRFPNERTVNN